MQRKLKCVELRDVLRIKEIPKAARLKYFTL
jgi:hypothetical protein